MDYHAFFWALVLYLGLLPGLVGAGVGAFWAWRRGAAPPRILMAAVVGFAVVAAVASLAILLLLGY